MVKTFMKPSHSLDTTDVPTLLHISCFQQSKLPSVTFREVQTFSTELERDRNQLVKMTIICLLYVELLTYQCTSAAVSLTIWIHSKLRKCV